MRLSYAPLVWNKYLLDEWMKEGMNIRMHLGDSQSWMLVSVDLKVFSKGKKIEICECV